MTRKGNKRTVPFSIFHILNVTKKNQPPKAEVALTCELLHLSLSLNMFWTFLHLLSEPHLMLKHIIVWLFWDSYLLIPPSSDDTDNEDKAEATSVCSLRYAGDGICHFKPHSLWPSGITPRVAKGHQQISSSKPVMDIIGVVGLESSCSADILQVGRMRHGCLAGCSCCPFHHWQMFASSDRIRLYIKGHMAHQ